MGRSLNATEITEIEVIVTQLYSEKGITPKEASGKEDTFICRLRLDVEDPKIIHYFVTFDNLLKGAALNGRQIVEYLLEHFFK